MDHRSDNKDLSELLCSGNGCCYTDIEDGATLEIKNLPGIKFNVLHLNIRSFHRNKDALISLLADVQERDVVVHVIGLCETFLNAQTHDLAEIDNYRSIHKFRTDRMGGGTSLLVHNSVRVDHLVNTPFVPGFESTSALLSYQSNQIFCCEIYRPPNGDDHVFSSCMNSLYAEFSIFHKMAFVCGDQNYDLLKSGAHQQTGECWRMSWYP